MKKICFLSFFSLLAISLSMPSFASSFPQNPLERMDIIEKRVQKDPNDPGAFPQVTKDSLPFFITLTVYTPADAPLSANAVIRMDQNASFYPENGANVLASRFDSASQTFTLGPICYTGKGRILEVQVLDMGNQSKVFPLNMADWTIPDFSENSSSQNSGENGGNNSNSSKNSSSVNTGSGGNKLSSSTPPASLSPHILLESFSAPERIPLNTTFSVFCVFQNTSSTLTAENLVFTASSGPSVFALTNGTNTHYLSRLGPGETTTIEYQCLLTEERSLFSLDISTSFEYYDLPGKNPTSKNGDKATIQLTRMPEPFLRLEVISLPENIYAGIGFSLHCRLANTGTSDISHVDLSLLQEGKEISRLFVGDLKKGGASTDVEIPSLSLPSPGQYAMTLTIYYRDIQENLQWLSQDFAFQVRPEEEMPSSGRSSSKKEGSSSIPTSIYVNPPANRGANALLPFLLIAMGGLTLYAVFLILTKKKSPPSKKPLSLAALHHPPQTEEDAKHPSETDS